MSDSADSDAPFFWDVVTGEPCLRRGNVLCHNPDWRNHRHVHREPKLTLTVVPGTEPVSALGIVEALGRVIASAEDAS